MITLENVIPYATGPEAALAPKPFTTSPRHLAALEHVRALAALGWDVTNLRRRVEGVVDAADAERCPDEARAWTVPAAAPSMTEHLQDGVLTCATLVAGRSYALSPGQRDILRERFGLTPGRTVTVSWVQVWPGTMVIRALRLESDVHYTDEQRKHVLRAVVLEKAWVFFRDAARRDTEREEGTGTGTEGGVKGPKSPKVPKTPKTPTLPPTDDFLADLVAEARDRDPQSGGTAK